jgi:biopolymer transport protein ExbD
MTPFHPAGPSRVILQRIACGLLPWLACAALTACYQPAPVAHADLRVTAQGDYRLDGAPVSAEQLRERVMAVKAEKAARAGGAGSGDLVVTIEPAPEADVARVRQAVDAVKQAQARVAFGSDAQVLQAAPRASGVPAD